MCVCVCTHVRWRGVLGSEGGNGCVFHLDVCSNRQQRGIGTGWLLGFVGSLLGGELGVPAWDPVQRPSPPERPRGTELL